MTAQAGLRRADGALRLAALLVLIAGAAVLAVTMFHNRHRYEQMAMVEFYDWARELRGGGDPWMPAREPGFHGLPGVVHRGQCNYPPAFLLAFRPLTYLGLRTAYWVWQSLLVACLLAAVTTSVGVLSGAEFEWYALAIGAVLLFPETYGSLYESEPTLLLMALMVAAYACDRHEHPFAAGSLLAAAALLKLFPALAGGYFLARRRWSTLGWAVAAGTAGLAACGITPLEHFIRFGMLHSNWLLDVHWLHNPRATALYYNLRAALDFMYGGSMPHYAASLWPALTAALELAIVGITLTLTYRAAAGAHHQLTCFGLWLSAILLVSPIAWGHYFTLAVPMWFAILAGWFRGEPLDRAGAILQGAALVLVYASYFSGAVRDIHGLFIAAVAAWLGGALTLSRWNGAAAADATEVRHVSAALAR